MTDILISGYYGFKNSGDDALLLAIINDLKEQKSDVRLTVLSKSPKETSENYKVKAVNRINPFSVIYNLIKSKMLLSGGGTLIQDGTSTKSLMYYLAIISLAHFFGKKIMLYSNGIGPLREEHRKMTKKVLNKADVITLRDPDSLQELEVLGVDKPQILLTADPAFSLKCENSEAGVKILKELGVASDKKIVCISVRNRKNIKESFCGELAKAADYLCDSQKCEIVFLPMQPAYDLEISKEIMRLMKNKSYCIEEKLDIYDMLSVIKNADLCIGMRLHSLIYSCANGVPVIGLVYDPKVEGFMRYMGQTMHLPIDELCFDRLKAFIDEAFENEAQIKSKLIKSSIDLKSRSKKSAESAIRLLCGKKGGDFIG